MDITTLPISLIDEDKDQPRYQFNQEALEELANSISEIGLLSPIKVRATDNGRYKIIYGNRRYKASLMVGLTSIPCIVSTATDDVDIYFEQIAENLTREDFSPIEEAEAFHKLLTDDRFRSSMKLLSSKLGKPESYIKNKCELLKFGPSVKKLIVGGTQIRKDCLTEDQLMPLKDLPFEYRDTLALTAARDELPVSDVKKIAKLFKDATISDSTKEKLLLKNGSGLIETWSVFEQNRKEKLAREKERKEKAELEAQRRAEDEVALQETKASQAQTVAYDAVNSEDTTQLHTSDHTISQQQNNAAAYNGQAPSTSSTMVMNEAYSLQQSVYTEQADQLLEQASKLKQLLQEGQINDVDAMEQLCNQMNIKLQQLTNEWKSIQQAIHN